MTVSLKYITWELMRHSGYETHMHVLIFKTLKVLDLRSILEYLVVALSPQHWV